MVQFKVSSLWLSAVLGRRRQILKDQDSMDIYRLPASPFSVGTYRGAPYQPAGLSLEDLPHLDAFLARAEGLDGKEARTTFIEGKGVSGTGDDDGRNLFVSWFKKVHIHDRINDLWDIVLADAGMTPQAFIKDRAEALQADEPPDFDGKMPNLGTVKGTCGHDAATAIFGAAAHGKRTINDEVAYACNGIWSHQWKRYEKKRNSAMKHCEKAREAYERKRDGECPLFACTHCAVNLPAHVTAALPRNPNKKDIQQLMSATRKFVNLGEWALDLESNSKGPVEAQAFLHGVMEAVGVEARKPQLAKGKPFRDASELNPVS